MIILKTILSRVKLSNPLKILMITSRADYGGGPEHLLRLISHLSKNFQIYIAAPDDEPYYKKFCDFVGEENVVHIPHRKFTIGALVKLILFVRKKNISIIHSHGKGAGVYSRIASAITGAKCIHTFHGIHIAEYSRVSAFLYIKIEQLLSLFTSKAISVSKGEYDLAISLSIIRKNKLEIIENGVIYPAQSNNDHNFHKPFRILTVTRFDYSKNSELIILIATELQKQNLLDDFEFHFVGRGEGEVEIANRIKNSTLRDKFIFHGFQNDLIKYYQDAFVYLSTSRWEGLPLSVLEAMSFGVPVIATDVRGNKDAVINNQTGYLYNIEKPETAASAIIDLHNNKELWLSLSLAARERVRNNFTVNRMAQLTEKLYFSINIK
jgi:glycosyltransferase involved in cell wall biosynthesis